MIIKNYYNQLQTWKYNLFLIFICLFSGFISCQSIAEENNSKEINQPIISAKTVSINDTEKSGDNQQAPNQNPILANEKNRINSGLVNNPWLFLHAYQANYIVLSDGDNLGEATRTLEKNKDIWKIKMSTKIKKWLLSLKSEEYSDFTLKSDQLITQNFFTTTKVSFKKAKTIEQTFNWITKTESGSKNQDKWELPLEEIVFDRMSHIIQLRADVMTNKQEFNYLISYKGKRYTYSYNKSGFEKITTPFGVFNALRLDRERGDDGKFSIWLSPDLNYFPIQIAQFEEDGPDIFMLLKNLEYTN